MEGMQPRNNGPKVKFGGKIIPTFESLGTKG